MFDEKSPSYPLSDHTRRLRRNLIIVAAIGIILVRFPEITLEKIPTSIGDFTAKDVGRNVVIGAINLICAYLLVFFAWNAANNYLNWSARKSWGEVAWTVRLPGISRTYADKYFGQYSWTPPYPKSLMELFYLFGNRIGNTKLKNHLIFWPRVIYVYMEQIAALFVHSQVLFLIDLFLPLVLAGYSLYLGRDHIQFVLARIF